MTDSPHDETNAGKQKPMPRFYRYTVTELPKILPIAYLCMIGIGMLFNYYKYSEFGINIFQYASVFDFLISPFEDYIIVLFTLFSLCLPTLLYFLDCYFEKHFPRVYRILTIKMSEKRNYYMIRILQYGALLVFYLWIMAMGYGSYSYKQVLKQQDVCLQFHDNETICGKQVGKTNDIFFVYQPDHTCKAIPIHSLVKEIVYQVPER